MAAMPGPSRADPHCGHTGNWHPPAAARPLGTGLSALHLLCQARCSTGRMGRGGGAALAPGPLAGCWPADLRQGTPRTEQWGLGPPATSARPF